MLLLSLGCLCLGFTLVYAGWRPGPNDIYAHEPWMLWVEAFRALNEEAMSANGGAVLA
ncbi:MAG: hypothetical protein M0Z95_18520 [Actinomycetota bacterium]|jgi:hypothetical protein|nr:hypothetical protein [Actinomycetota bacterium]